MHLLLIKVIKEPLVGIKGQLPERLSQQTLGVFSVMGHTGTEVFDAIMARVDEAIFAVHDAHKSESKCVINKKFIVVCTWSLAPGCSCLTNAREGAPSPLDKTLASGSSCFHLHALLPAPACTTACACSTHILFDLSLAMSGSGGYFPLLAPAISKVLSPVVALDVASSVTSSSLSISKETCAFIPKNCDVIEPLFRSMMSSFCILIGCQGNSDAPSGDFLYFSMQKGSDVFRIPWR